MTLKKFLCIILTTVLVFAFAGCGNFPESNSPNNTNKIEQPHLYWKNIDVTVTEVNKKHWFATTHHYILDVTVHSEEYSITKTLTEQGSGAFGTPEHWDIQKGDKVKVKLYSWVMDSTGKIVRRDIHSFS